VLSHRTSDRNAGLLPNRSSRTVALSSLDNKGEAQAFALLRVLAEFWVLSPEAKEVNQKNNLLILHSALRTQNSVFKTFKVF
jgi:hypothetical protein